MLKKDYATHGHSCRVTFELSGDIEARNVALCGEFNNWDPTTYPMKRTNGNFVLTLSLKPGQRYRYKYLLDGQHWENDWQADDYVPNEYGSEDSVVEV